MKITTWNVNGYRAAWSKGLPAWIQTSQPDALCLQEIKVRPDQLTAEQLDLPGYQAYWNPAERAGYSGVATFLRDPAQKVEYGLGEMRFDCEGRVIRSHHPGFVLLNVYFPSGQRGRERVDFKLEFYGNLLAICDRLHAAGEQVIITGDFNTAHREIDLANPKQNRLTSGFLPEERVWIDYFLQHGFVDAFRHLYPERVGYTWWTYRAGARLRNIGWRLDYFLVSEGLMSRVSEVTIHPEVTGSDHCPVSLTLD